MGPQPSSRGNRRITREQIAGESRLASMGPQPSSRGNVCSPSSNGPVAPDRVLQWGRNLPVAEIALRASAIGMQRSCSLLQWGRNLPVAEMRHLPASANLLIIN